MPEQMQSFHIGHSLCAVSEVDHQSVAIEPRDGLGAGECSVSR
jgi:hypothetical protein